MWAELRLEARDGLNSLVAVGAVELELLRDAVMELFQAADQFGVERLKKICESKMLGSICVENAAQIFHAADQHNARSLREKTLNFILANFDPVTKTPCFEEMGRTNVDLVFASELR